MFLSFLIFRIPEITSVANSKSGNYFSSKGFISGQDAIIKASSGVLLAIYCQISSVKNGMNGCNNFKFTSNISIALLNVVHQLVAGTLVL